MNPLPTYLEPLEFDAGGDFPREAILAAVQNREDSIPHLLHSLERIWDKPALCNEYGDPYSLHLYAFFLLAEFREPRAYPLIVRIMRHPLQEQILGDMLLDAGHRILASVCGNQDTRPIEEMIEDPELDEFVRSTALESMGVFLHCGFKSREEVSAYFGSLLQGLLERETNFVWDSLIEVCVDFGMAEHLPEIRRLYRQNIAHSDVRRLLDVETEIIQPPRAATKTNPPYTLIDSAVDESELWHRFPAEEEATWNEVLEDEAESRLIYRDESALPYIRPTPKVGRNDLCPCGSGKKFKKCCGSAAT